MMSIPPEIAWVFPIIIPFLIGLLIGAIAKRTLKLMLLLASLVILLVISGTVSLTFQDIYDRAMEFLPKLISTGHGVIDILPYSSVMFMIGLAVGLWKG